MKVNSDYMNNETKIQNFLDNNHGYISTSDFLDLNISKPMIKKYIDMWLIRKVSHGLYIDSNLLVDEGYVLQRRYSKAIFLYKTAFNLLGFIKGLSKQLEVTINSRKRVLGDYKVHYVPDKYYDIGIIEIKNMFGNSIRIYNAERCICDMLKRNDFGLELQNHILRDYFKSKEKDIDKLLEYSKIFNVYEKVNTLVEYAIG